MNELPNFRPIGQFYLKGDNLVINFVVEDWPSDNEIRSENDKLDFMINIISRFDGNSITTSYYTDGSMIYKDLKEIVKFINDRIDACNADTIDFFTPNNSSCTMMFEVGPKYTYGTGPNGVHLLISSGPGLKITGRANLFFDYDNAKKLVDIFNEEYKRHCKEE